MKFLVALILILSLGTAYAESIPKYERSEFGGWYDIDKDCQDTRQEVLIEESLIPVGLDDRGCKVLSGLWVDPFTGISFADPTALDIDHIVPLKHAWYAGAYKWTKAERKEYANNLTNKNHLIAVYKSANRSKGYRGPTVWVPPNLTFLDEYVTIWEEIKINYGLTIDATEATAITKYKILGLKYNKSFRVDKYPLE